MTKTIVTAAACATLLWINTAQGAASDEQKCLSKRAAAAGKYESCVQKWLGKQYAGGTLDTKAQEKLAKCRIKYEGVWPKLQKLAASATCGDILRFIDNMDGTVTDSLTGLVWEKKTTAAGSGMNLADRHDVDNLYTWSTGSNNEDGTAYTDFLSNLNSGGFASANGWRLPTFAELQTILLPEEYPCTSNPCIDSKFGSTQGFGYWSATTSSSGAALAWFVNFGSGSVGSSNKTLNGYVRAVRGGL